MSRSALHFWSPLVALLAFTPAGARDSAGPTPTPEPQDVLAAAEAGLVEVRFIPNDARSAQVVVASRGDRPLTLRLPAAFAGVPILAQQVGAGFGQGGIGGVPQNVGGGGMQNQGMGIGGAMGGNPFGGCWVAREVYGVHDPRWLAFREWMIWRAPAWLQDAYLVHGESLAAWLRDRPAAKAGLRLLMDRAIASRAQPVATGSQLRVIEGPPTAPFTVAAGKSLTLRVPTVCLDYGRREPTPRIPYRLVALETVSQDPKLAMILQGLAQGYLTQKVAQAAAWHLSSGRSWDELAAEVIDRAGGDPDLPVFSPAELAAARNAVEVVARLAAKRAAETPADSSAP